MGSASISRTREKISARAAASFISGSRGTPGSSSHSPLPGLRREDNLALEYRPGKVRLPRRRCDFPARWAGRGEVDDNPSGRDFRAQVSNALLVTAVEAVGDSQQRGELLDSQAFGRRQRGELLVF